MNRNHAIIRLSGKTVGTVFCANRQSYTSIIRWSFVPQSPSIVGRYLCPVFPDKAQTVDGAGALSFMAPKDGGYASMEKATRKGD